MTIDVRPLYLGLDSLLVVTVRGLLPWVFEGYGGVLDGRGAATARIHLPREPALVGLRFYTAWLLLDPAAPSGVKRISRTIAVDVR